MHNVPNIYFVTKLLLMREYRETLDQRPTVPPKAFLESNYAEKERPDAQLQQGWPGGVRGYNPKSGDLESPSTDYGINQ